MGRGRIEIKRIENPASRQVTFCKRRNGLLKKACELSVLCDAEVALIVFSTRGRLFEYSSNSIRSTIEKYKKVHAGASSSCTVDTNSLEYFRQESSKLKQQIQVLENANKHLIGESLGSLPDKELKQLESRIERGLGKIRSKKEAELEKENMYLRAKIAENDRGQQTGIVVMGTEYDDAVLGVDSRNYYQLNVTEGHANYSHYQDQTALHLGYQ